MYKIVVSLLLAVCLVGVSVAYADGPITKVLYDGSGYPDQMGAIGPDSVFALSDNGVTIDTTTDPAQLGGYYALVPAIDHNKGYTITLRYKSDLGQKSRPTTQGLKFLVTSHSPQLGNYGTIEMVLWRDGVQLGHNFFFGLNDNGPEKNYTIGVKWDSYYIAGSAFIFYDFIIYEGEQLVTRKRFFEAQPIITPTPLNFDPYAVDGWLWFGDDTKAGVVDAELQYLAIEYIGQRQLYMPIIAN